jgi:hypothetical protein
MASRQRNGGMLWRTGAWSGLALLAVLDGSLLMLPATTPGAPRAPGCADDPAGHGPPVARAGEPDCPAGRRAIDQRPGPAVLTSRSAGNGARDGEGRFPE